MKLLLGKLKRFSATSGADRRRIYEAAVLLGLARFAVLTIPFRFIAPWLSRAPETGSCDPILLSQISNAVTVAARNVPWNAVCLPQAMAAKAMLARRGCGSAVHFAATIDKSGKVVAHAWLGAGGQVVVGEAGIGDMSPLARFG